MAFAVVPIGGREEGAGDHAELGRAKVHEGESAGADVEDDARAAEEAFPLVNAKGASLAPELGEHAPRGAVGERRADVLPTPRLMPAPDEHLVGAGVVGCSARSAHRLEMHRVDVGERGGP